MANYLWQIERASFDVTAVQTIIAEQCLDPEQCEQAHKTLVKVRKVLPDCSDIDTIDDVLIKANVDTMSKH